tara:strand:- start:8154 stop:11459 length:3306 start_codon:yes stop_codon:yes gene_type:complete
MNVVKKSGSANLVPALLSVFVLFLGTALTIAMWQHNHRREQVLLHSAFSAEAERLVAVAENQLHTYSVVMRGLRGYFQGSESVEYPEFLAYTRALNATSELAGLQAVAWVQLVPRSGVDKHLEVMRAQLPVDYDIRPPGDADWLAPIAYIEPMAGANLRAIGLDIYQVPVARAAAEKARDLGEIVITRPLQLVQDQRGDNFEQQVQPGSPSFVMYIPIYGASEVPGTLAARRERITGYIDVPFRVRDLIGGMAREVNAELDFDIFDGDPADPDNLLYLSDAISHEERGARGEAQIERSLTVGTRRWTFYVSSTPAFRTAVLASGRSSMMFIAGGAASLALALLVLVIARGRDRSDRRAERLASLYHALSEVNQAVVRMDSEADLMPLVCNVAVRFGGFTLAWVGRIDPDTGDIIGVAGTGEGREYFDSKSLSIHADHPGGGGSMATAARENRPVVINDYLDASLTEPWHDRAREFGWRSSAAFPIPRGGKPFAVLSVYHAHRNAFDGEAMDLLREMSADISFALNNFDREEQRASYEKAIRESESLLSTILENVGACIYLKDLDGKYLFVNQQVLATWDIEREQLIGRGDDELFEVESVARIRESDRKVLTSGISQEREEVETLRNTGKSRVFWSVKIPLRDADGKVYALCGISTDITEHRDNRDRILFLSNYDPLTGLPNRELLHEKTRFAVTAAAASSAQLSLLYIDLDRFQLINESLGLAVGDGVIKALSNRLTAALNLEATLCRMGGDEFFLLLPSAGQSEAAEVAERLLRLIAEPLDLDSHRLSVTASMGVACFPEHGRDLDQLLQSADAALSRAKLSGRNAFCVFEEEMRVHANETLQIENQLREALAGGDLSLHYQPQVSLTTGEITGVEALVRWQHATLGFVPPSRFIPIAEESGLILDIGSWVLRTAIAQQAQWQAAGLPVGPVAVNLSAMQIYRDDFADMVSQMLADAGVPAALLDLELTERIAMESSGKTLATLADLHHRGVVLSIDDFGTGYSSLSYLKRYPVQKLKIDKSFVDGLAEDREDQAIALAIIGVARGLGFRTVAEGVETEAQWQFLKDNGCDEFQGYYFSKPLPASEFEALLRQVSSSGAG